LRFLPPYRPFALRLALVALAISPAANAASDYSTPYTFTTIAGLAGIPGVADGQGTIALFNNPFGLAIDGSGNVFVADSLNDTIRKITPSGAVSTFAGSHGAFGSRDGTGSAAEFGALVGIAVDGGGNVYVSDSNFNVIRKVTPAGVVTTLAGTPGITGHADGTGPAAQFSQPDGIGVDAAGNVYVADSNNQTVRKITAGGVVTTLAGMPGVVGTANGTGSQARFNQPAGLVSDPSGNVYVSDNSNTIRRISPAGVVTAFVGTTGVAGSADGTGLGAQFDQPAGMAFDALGNLYVSDSFNETIRMITPAGTSTTLAGRVGQVGSADGTGTTALFNGPVGIAVDAGGNLYVADTYNDTIRKGSAAAPGSTPTRLINISTRAQVGSGANILIPGFVIAGTGTETLLIRADGPSLNQFSVSGTLAVPVLTVFDSSQRVIAMNKGWDSGTNAQAISAAAAAVGAFPLESGTTDCALIISLPAGAYTVQVSSGDGTTGIALAEVYEMSSTGTRLTNISTRAQVGTGGNVLIPGFVVSGSGHENLLMRADGPSLAEFGLTGILEEPVLRVDTAGENTIDADTGWSTNLNADDIAAAAANVGAFAFQPNSNDSATLISLSPGSYTMEVSGVNDTTGVALEIYELP
jgi:sugar lactone lactonase YvrE